jgi:hypothetical protein
MPLNRFSKHYTWAFALSSSSTSTPATLNQHTTKPAGFLVLVSMPSGQITTANGRCYVKKIMPFRDLAQLLRRLYGDTTRHISPFPSLAIGHVHSNDAAL